MKKINFFAVSVFTMVLSLNAFADDDYKSGTQSKSSDNTRQTMPMMGGYQGHMPMMYGNQERMGMMYGYRDDMAMSQYMKQRQATMQAHMLKMEKHLADIAASLKELIELQKRK